MLDAHTLNMTQNSHTVSHDVFIDKMKQCTYIQQYSFFLANPIQSRGYNNSYQYLRGLMFFYMQWQ